MPSYDVAVVFTIEANSYVEAVNLAKEWKRRGHSYPGTRPAGCEEVSVETEFEVDDANQRVLYLHPEDEDNEGNPDETEDEDDDAEDYSEETAEG